LLIEEEGYDIIFWKNKVFWETDEAPYIHCWSSGGDRPPNSAIEKLCEIYGVRRVPDVPRDKFIDVLALQALHKVDDEPYWMAIFEGSVFLEQIRAEYNEDELHEGIEEQIEAAFFPDDAHHFYEMMGNEGGPFHRLTRWVYEIGGREGREVYHTLFEGFINEDGAWQMDELEAAQEAWLRGDDYWGTMNNPYHPLSELVRRIPPGAFFSPLEAEEEIRLIDWGGWEPPFDFWGMPNERIIRGLIDRWSMI